MPCGYCGAPTRNDATTCRAHSDLPSLDPCRNGLARGQVRRTALGSAPDATSAPERASSRSGSRERHAAT